MATKTEICNMALGHLGHAKEIATIDDNTNEARACKAFYDTALNETLRAFSWPFATRYVALSLVEEDPNDEWTFSYTYPVNCLKILRIVSGTVNETESTRVAYKVIGADSGRLILVNAEDPSIEYVHRDTNPAIYPDDFVMALAYRLAFYIGPRVVGREWAKMQQNIISLYNMAIRQAAVHSSSEQQIEQAPEAEMTRARY